jgi:hypothetical protein
MQVADLAGDVGAKSDIIEFVSGRLCLNRVDNGGQTMPANTGPRSTTQGGDRRNSKCGFSVLFSAPHGMTSMINRYPRRFVQEPGHRADEKARYVSSQF